MNSNLITILTNDFHFTSNNSFVSTFIVVLTHSQYTRYYLHTLQALKTPSHPTEASTSSRLCRTSLVEHRAVNEFTADELTTGLLGTVGSLITLRTTASAKF